MSPPPTLDDQDRMPVSRFKSPRTDSHSPLHSEPKWRILFLSFLLSLYTFQNQWSDFFFLKARKNSIVMTCLYLISFQKPHPEHGFHFPSWSVNTWPRMRSLGVSGENRRTCANQSKRGGRKTMVTQMEYPGQKLLVTVCIHELLCANTLPFLCCCLK